MEKMNKEGDWNSISKDLLLEIFVWCVKLWNCSPVSVVRTLSAVSKSFRKLLEEERVWRIEVHKGVTKIFNSISHRRIKVEDYLLRCDYEKPVSQWRRFGQESFQSLQGILQGSNDRLEIVRGLCKKVQELLVEEPNTVDLSSPIIIVGDIHGQFDDLLQIFRLCGPPPQNKYLFLGDYVDRGIDGVSVLTILYLLKILYPNHITLLRGHHECRNVSEIFGFFDECKQKFSSEDPYLKFVETFNSLPLAAVIDRKYFCVHGGLSPDLDHIDELSLINRFQEIPDEGIVVDIIWSEPENIEDWIQPPKGFGWVYGHKVVAEFNKKHGFSHLVRSHRVAEEGWKVDHNGQTITVWSAPNYAYRVGNLGAVMKVDGNSQHSFVCYKHVPPPETDLPKPEIEVP